MKFLLLFTIIATIACSSSAAILPNYHDMVVNEMDKEIAELYKKRDDRANADLSAAAEYFQAPHASKQNVGGKSVDCLSEAAVEYFKAPEWSQRHSKAQSLTAQKSLAAAAEYFKTPELPRKGLTASELEAAAAAYFSAPHLPESKIRTDPNEAVLAAAAEYFKAPKLSESKIRSDPNEAVLAAAAEYFRAPELSEPKLRRGTNDAVKAAAEYFRAPEAPSKKIIGLNSEPLSNLAWNLYLERSNIHRKNVKKS
uniref:Uncharacterized protein n=1 Tax=Ceratitis capitata TaxID=7213 RepID=W8C6K6_CERCA